MIGILLFIPFFVIRFGLLAALDRNAIRRAAHFAPVQGKEQGAYWVYQLSNVAIIIIPFFLTIKTIPPALLWTGTILYAAGTVLLVVSVVNFATPAENGMNTDGLYRFSRNPMYVAYFFYFIGCAVLTQSPLLFGAVIVFQISAHWIIISEERWCLERFGDAYRAYKDTTRRYI